VPKHTNHRLQGTLDLLVLKTLNSRGRMHGYGITLHVQQASEDALRIEEGSLYPALHRMTQAGWLKAEWGSLRKQSPSPLLCHHSGGPEATRKGRKSWTTLTGAVARVLQGSIRCTKCARPLMQAFTTSWADAMDCSAPFRATIT
jgi:hypothetical protein